MRPSARARNLSVHVHPGGKVEVVAPERARPRDVEAFVAENREWIRRARRNLGKAPAIDRAPPASVSLAAIDREVRVNYGVGDLRGDFAERGDGMLSLRPPLAHRQKCRTALRAWLAQTGKSELVPWLREVSQDIRIEYTKTQVRGQKTRWGSCSSRGTISINFCLLFLQPELVRYLFVHELCHRRHFNHSKRYWQLVKSVEPDYRRLDRALGEAWREVPGWVL